MCSCGGQQALGFYLITANAPPLRYGLPKAYAAYALSARVVTDGAFYALAG
jgi:hypothetical protein